ncbi:Carbohydrate binding domain protein [Verrucomicrobiia bacterium DG1235]|nr:Carbohydrate binding domain protein [Verrucomicrobiae bacterium DG1235]
MKTTPLISLFALLASLLSPARAGELIPFTLPWNDAAPGITDLSSLNHTPAGKHGYISVDADAHFTVGDERIRLWGVNITADSCFPTHAEAEGIAARLAKFGFNIVRFHHMDNNWGSGSIIDYAQGNSRNLHAANLEKLDYFIAQLKSHGIYSNINLINSREFLPSDGLDAGVANLEWKARHILGFVDPTLRDLEKEYARKLLTHVNPYTGLTYAEDPAIAVVEINNENGIFQTLFDGHIALWPQVYKDQLQTKWNTWLSDRYADTAELLAAWSGTSVPFGPQLITNPTFTNGTTNWNIEQREGAAVTATTGTFTDRQAIKLDVTSAASAGWHIQMNQSGKNLTEGQLYTLSFWVRADSERSLSAAIGQAYDPWGTIQSFNNVAVTTEWTQHTFLFESAVSDSNLRLNFNGFAQQTGALYLSDISLQVGGDLSATLPDGQTLEAANIQTNVESGADLPNRTLDWTRFLIDLGTDYWTDMGSYIKDELAYSGLVNGTTIMNSTPNIQGVFDLVDTHSYWQHPVFPGEDWDPNNWYVNPVSMVNDLNGSTFAGLARQRVDGFPHTVSEYRHAYPNPFASEGPLLIAAYGSLQDWDGIYFFDYAKGSSWDQGYWDNYFNMNAHPSAMGNALAAARMFRQGHVSASSGQLLFNFNPDLEAELVATRGRAWNVGDGRQLDIPPEHIAIQRIALSIGEDATGLTGTPPAAPAGPVYAADTNQLQWDLSLQDQGVITIDTPQTIGMVGYVSGRTFGNSQVGIEIGDTQENWATLTIAAQQGSFENPYGQASLLIVATGLTENTGMIWTDETKSSVGRNWGSGPSMTEAIPATITLPYAPERVQAWALDETGQRSASLTIAPTENGSSLQIGAAQKSLWYEVQVTADETHDPYTTWRQSQWADAQEQTDDALSGPAADPDLDGIRNLVEYLADLDPHSPDAKNPIQQSITWQNQKPTFTYRLPIPIDYPVENLSIAATQNLVSWTTHALGQDPVSITVESHTTTHNTLVIQHEPSNYPAFSTLQGPSQ